MKVLFTVLLVPIKAGDRADFFIPFQKLWTAERNRNGREGEMERGEKRDKWQEIKYGRARRALQNFRTWCSLVTLFSVARPSPQKQDLNF